MTFRYILLAMLATFLWGAAFPLIKTALEFVPPFLLAGSRFSTSFLILIPCVGPLAFIKFCKKEWKIVLVVGVFQSLIQYGLFYTAMNSVPAAKVSILVGLSPILTVIMAHFFLHNDRMTIRKIVSVIVGVCGAITITLAKSTWVNGENDYFEVMLIFLALFSSSISTIYIKKKGGATNAVALNAGQLLIGGSGLFIIGLLKGDWQQATFNSVSLSVIVATALISAISFTLWFFLLKKVPVTSLNIWKSFIPVCGTFLSWTFLSTESFNVPTMVGVVLVVCAILIMNINFRALRKIKK